MKSPHKFCFRDFVSSLVVVLALGGTAIAGEIAVPTFLPNATSDWLSFGVTPENTGTEIHRTESKRTGKYGRESRGRRTPAAFTEDSRFSSSWKNRQVGFQKKGAGEGRLSGFVQLLSRPKWREAGTIFRWSSNPDATGGPDLDEPLVTDRPDFTEASTTVGRGVAQIEFGYTYNYDSTAGQSERVSSWGEPLLRYGIIADWLEFRIALFPVEQRILAGGRRQTTSGTEDLYLGFKIGLTPQGGFLPEMALIPQMTVPTGSRAFTANQTQPGLNGIYAWKINEHISTAGSTQFNLAFDDGTSSSYVELAQSWTVSLTLTEKLGMYSEWFAFFPLNADTARVEHNFNFGFTYLINNDIQWDVRYGRGLNAVADDYFIGTGLSIRFR